MKLLVLIHFAWSKDLPFRIGESTFLEIEQFSRHATHDDLQLWRTVFQNEWLLESLATIKYRIVMTSTSGDVVQAICESCWWLIGGSKKADSTKGHLPRHHFVCHRNAKLHNVSSSAW